MALFGDLEHHTLTDLAKVLRSQTGTLFFHEAYQHRTLELTLVQGQVHALYLDGFPVRGAAQVRDILQELQAQGRGAFEFQRREFPAAAPRLYALDLGTLLQGGREAFIPADHLPHPDTRFVLNPGAQPVPPALAEGWALLRPHLGGEAGASASELARYVGRPEADLLVTLHRLRALDLIAPQRAAAPSRHSQGPAPSPQPPGPALEAPTPDGAGAAASALLTPAAPVALVQRLLGALKRLGGGART